MLRAKNNSDAFEFVTVMYKTLLVFFSAEAVYSINMCRKQVIIELINLCTGML